MDPYIVSYYKTLEENTIFKIEKKNYLETFTSLTKLQLKTKLLTN